MVKDKEEKNRKLSEAEQRRLSAYEELSAAYMAQGYRRTELTVGIVAANIFALICGLPVIIISVILFVLLHPGKPPFLDSLPQMILLLVVMLVLVVVHELVHGITWSLFAEHHWKDIEFGFMKEYLTPYCTCACPLDKGHYILGALMPLILLGLIPLVIAIIAGSAFWLYLGIIMTLSAGGDIMIVINLLRYKSQAKEIVYIDHPTQAGGVIFER